MPRGYRLGRRAAQKDSTRARIVQAAIELYTERGISRTSMAQVARRADVAPATVLNHFAGRDDLDRAIVERAWAEMPPPDSSIFEGAATLGERIARLLRRGGIFLDAAGPWYRMWLREPMLSEPWAEAGRAAGERWEAVFRAALGRLESDQAALDLLRATLEPAFFDAVRGGRRTTEETADLIARAVTPWLEQRERALG